MPKSQHSKHRSPEPSQNTDQTTKINLQTHSKPRPNRQSNPPNQPNRHHLTATTHPVPRTNDTK